LVVLADGSECGPRGPTLLARSDHGRADLLTGRWL
jgi:hypothetical protein